MHDHMCTKCYRLDVSHLPATHTRYFRLHPTPENYGLVKLYMIYTLIYLITYYTYYLACTFVRT